jgi:hypothetical protein
MSVELFEKEAFKLVESIVDNSVKEWVFKWKNQRIIFNIGFF